MPEVFSTKSPESSGELPPKEALPPTDEARKAEVRKKFGDDEMTARMQKEKEYYALAHDEKDPARLARAAEGNDPRARASVAQNEYTPQKYLKQFSQDKDESLRALVAGNPTMPTADLVRLATKDTSLFVRLSACKNPNLPEKLIVERANSLIGIEKVAIADHPKLPTAQALQMLQNEDYNVLYPLMTTTTDPVVARALLKDRMQLERIIILHDTKDNIHDTFPERREKMATRLTANIERLEKVAK